MPKKVRDVLYLLRIDFSVASNIDVSVNNLEDAVHAWMIVKWDSTSASNDENANGDVAILVYPDVCNRSRSKINSNTTIESAFLRVSSMNDVMALFGPRESIIL